MKKLVILSLLFTILTSSKVYAFPEGRYKGTIRTISDNPQNEQSILSEEQVNIIKKTKVPIDLTIKKYSRWYQVYDNKTGIDFYADIRTNTSITYDNKEYKFYSPRYKSNCNDNSSLFIVNLNGRATVTSYEELTCENGFHNFFTSRGTMKFYPLKRSRK